MSEPTRPQPNEYDPYYAKYVSKVGEGPLLDALAANGARTAEIIRNLDPARADFAYAPGKWSVRQVLAHMADVERVFAYRALHAARGGEGALPGMDEQRWAEARDVTGVTLADLAAELAALRQGTLLLLRPLRPQDWSRSVQASGAQVTVRALAFMIAGHELHHQEALRERYGAH